MDAIELIVMLELHDFLGWVQSIQTVQGPLPWGDGDCGYQIYGE